MSAVRKPPSLLSEFAGERRGWHVSQEKLDCWVARRRFIIAGKDLLFLVTPNWREKESGHDWIGELIDSSNGNARLSSHLVYFTEVLESVRRDERTVELGYALGTPHVSRDQALVMLRDVR